MWVTGKPESETAPRDPEQDSMTDQRRLHRSGDFNDTNRSDRSGTGTVGFNPQ
jgi:hypothetical protein